MPGVNALQVDDGVAVPVLLGGPGEDGAEVAGADRQDKLVRVEVNVAAGQRHVGQDFSPAELFGRVEEDRVVVVPLQAEVLATHLGQGQEQVPKGRLKQAVKEKLVEELES